MGLRGDACIVGYAQQPSERWFTGTPNLTLEQWADMTAVALRDASIESSEVDGLACASDVFGSSFFVPVTIAEYTGWSVNLAESVDLGGAAPAGMVWRAAAIELGLCEVEVMAVVASAMPPSPVPRRFDDRIPFGASSSAWGSPRAEFGSRPSPSLDHDRERPLTPHR